MLKKCFESLALEFSQRFSWAIGLGLFPEIFLGQWPWNFSRDFLTFFYYCYWIENLEQNKIVDTIKTSLFRTRGGKNVDNTLPAFYAHNVSTVGD